jgi:hypothetical protein
MRVIPGKPQDMGVVKVVLFEDTCGSFDQPGASDGLNPNVALPGIKPHDRPRSPDASRGVTAAQ